MAAAAATTDSSKTGPPDVSGMHTLKVDNLTYQTSIDELRAEFSRFGEVGDIYIPRHFGSGDPKGYAFVRFHDIRDAEDAINGMNEKEIDGRVIRVQMARNKRPEDPKSFYSRGRRDDRYDGNRGRDRSRDRDSYRRRSRSGDREGYDSRRRSRSRSGDRDRYYDRRGDNGRDSYRRDDRDRGAEYRPRY